MRLPKRITPCPIVDSVVELRFEPAVPGDAVFGLVFNAVRGEYPSFEKLPLAQVPELLREQDAALRCAPLFEAKAQGLVFKVGPRAIALCSPKEYVGWAKLSEGLFRVLDCMGKAGVAKMFTRLGIRYIDFFERDIYPELVLAVLHDQAPLKARQLTVRALVDSGEFRSNLSVINNGTLTLGGQVRQGSVIDTDTFVDEPARLVPSLLRGTIEECHAECKKVFFGLLQQRYLDTLNPEF